MKNQNIKGTIRAGLLLLLLTIMVSAAKAQSTTISIKNATALKAALSSPAGRIKEIQLNTMLSPKQKQQQMEVLLAKRHRAIDSLLTPEQKKAFLEGAAAARQASYRQTGNDTTKLTQ